MKIDIDPTQALSLERKMSMHEAREAIIYRLARDLPTNIDLERFLNVVVSEIGRMLHADRCDLLQLSEGQELRISHEWRKDKSVPVSQGTKIPFDTEKLAERFRVCWCSTRKLNQIAAAPNARQTAAVATSCGFLRDQRHARVGGKTRRAIIGRPSNQRSRSSANARADG